MNESLEKSKQGFKNAELSMKLLAEALAFRNQIVSIVINSKAINFKNYKKGGI
jgi:hypothetical protein